MEKIKIVYCLVGLDGGVGNLLFNYLDHMNSEKFDIKIVAQDVSSEFYKNEYERRGFEVIKVCSKRESLLKNLSQLRLTLRGADIVHAHMTLTNVFPLAVAWSLGIHNRISHGHLAGKVTFKTSILAFLTRCFSTEYWACGINAGRYLYPNQSYKVINNAIELGKYKYNESVRTHIREEYKVKKNDLVIGNVGRFTEQKNHKFLIDVFKEILQMNSDAYLMLVGEGNEKDKIIDYAREKGVYEKIVFTGVIGNVAEVLSAIDVFVLPSLFEGLPVSVIEAEASGLPCVISSKVTDEVMINDNVIALSLEDPIEIWAKKIIDISKQNRQVDQHKLDEAGYNIIREAHKLEEIYIEMRK